MRSTPACLLAGATVLALLVSAPAPAGSGSRHGSGAKPAAASGGEWVELFNGKDLTGWKVSENPDTFRVEGGLMVVAGPRAHAFYVGDVGGADFTDFELRLEVLTKPNANSGVFFHTEYQEEGWPVKGYEAQVNQTHKDFRKTGSIYDVQDVENVSPAVDDAWFVYDIRVDGKKVTVSVDGKVVNEYIEPENVEPPAKKPGRKLSHGTIAIQGHDPGSVVYYRSIKLRLRD